MPKVLYNINYNVVEGFNRIVAKFIGGKQVNFF